MLFNSYEFIFLFLPLALAGFYLLGARSRTWALRWLILASLVFYAWWRPLNVLIIAPSVLVNYLLARTLQRLGKQGKQGPARAVLLTGIAFNVAFLGYFKYAGFAVSTVNDAFGTAYVLERIVLPLGISFITFQKIAFLVDVHAGRVTEFTLGDFALFVLFFPQLISGPIVHYREMMPQFQKVSGRVDPEQLSVGITLFLSGLFKKVVLADVIAPLVTDIYARAGGGEAISLLPAWLAALGFTFQIYFDFSGYTEMALGVARCFGIRFPPNFDSPLKASSIIDFWMRWHMTLTRFLTAYIYNPLALALTRRRMARGLPGFQGTRTTPGAFLLLLVLPTMVTMVLSGIWHGAGYLFILWGFVHGIYLAVNHSWRFFARSRFADRARYERIMGPTGFVLTFLAVAVAMVLFRSPNVSAAWDILRGLTGANGVTAPSETLVKLAMETAALGSIALLLPSTLQLLARYEPALGYHQPARLPFLDGLTLAWRPSISWALVAAAVLVMAVFRLGGPSEFLYWQF